MAKKTVVLYSILTLLLLVPLCLKSQITIGSEVEPMPGSILDLKENNAKGANSTKGLLLPRMELSDKNKLYPMFSGNYDSDKQDPLHTGLIVYNINTCFYRGAGPYAWDGTEWVFLVQEANEVYKYKDQEGNPFLARKFGDAGIWMVQNLAVTTYDDIRDSDNKTINPSKVVYSPNNNPNLPKQYPWMGYLYDRDTATNKYVTDSKNYVQGICPNGWHVPSYQEWMLLENELINNTKYYTTSNENFIDKGVKLQTTPQNGKYTLKYGNDTFKLMSALLSPCPVPAKLDIVTTGISLNEIQGGFNIRLVGGMINSTTVDGYGEKSGFWMSDKASNTSLGRNKVIIVKHATDQGMVNIHNNDGGSARAYSIRCKKNDDTP